MRRAWKVSGRQCEKRAVNQTRFKEMLRAVCNLGEMPLVGPVACPAVNNTQSLPHIGCHNAELHAQEKKEEPSFVRARGLPCL